MTHIIHAYRDAADKLGLKRVPPAASSEDYFSIFDGSRFVFQQSTWDIVTLWRMVQRYWLTYFTFAAPKQMLQKFLRLYDLQKQGISFDTPEAFLSKLELYDLTQQSMHDYLEVTATTIANVLHGSILHDACYDTTPNAEHGASLGVRFDQALVQVSSRSTPSACLDPYTLTLYSAIAQAESQHLAALLVCLCTALHANLDSTDRVVVYLA